MLLWLCSDGTVPKNKTVTYMEARKLLVRTKMSLWIHLAFYLPDVATELF